MNLPTEFQGKMKSLLREDYENYIRSFDQQIGQTLRVNLLKTEPAKLFRRFPSAGVKGTFAPVPWCGAGAYYEGEERLSLHPYYQAGLFYLQDPSAMAPAAFLPVKPGDKVLDLCAAPGGKTTALAGALKGQGLLVANDISISRCRALLKNVEMAGVTNAIVTCESPERLAEHFPAYFDRILVDAPCSGEGMFRKDPSMIRHWSPEEVARYATLQKEILQYAARMLKPGGYLMYSTCTYSPEEDEQVVETLLSDGAFTLESMVSMTESASLMEFLRESGCTESPLAHCLRFWNHRVRGEGQFTALLRKAGGSGKEAPIRVVSQIAENVAASQENQDTKEPIPSQLDMQAGYEIEHLDDFVSKNQAFIEEKESKKEKKGKKERKAWKDSRKKDGYRTGHESGSKARRGQVAGKQSAREQASGKRAGGEHPVEEFYEFLGHIRPSVSCDTVDKHYYYPDDFHSSTDELSDKISFCQSTDYPDDSRSPKDESWKLKDEPWSLKDDSRGLNDKSCCPRDSFFLPSGDALQQRLYRNGERLFLLPENAPDMSGLRVVSSGLHLGNCRKNRFEPSQALAMALTASRFDQVLRLSLQDQRLERYLRCETIPLYPGEAGDKGWVLVCVEEYPLGWGKLVNGQLRNKYPAGWRRQ